jgi:hypothetical protein
MEKKSQMLHSSHRTKGIQEPFDHSSITQRKRKMFIGFMKDELPGCLQEGGL